MRGRVEVEAEILLRIARALGRTMEWLLTGEDRPWPPRKRTGPRAPKPDLSRERQPRHQGSGCQGPHSVRCCCAI